jgi:outer membrane protein OmpA-like peptidoglycan-associated protein
MGLFKLFIKTMILFLGCTVITSCSIFLKPEPLTPFQEAIPTLAGTLLNHVKANLSAPVGKRETHVMIIPFSDADSDEVPEISREIEKIIIEEGTRNFEGFNISRLTSKNIVQADYIINGTIQLESYPRRDTKKPQKYYRVYGEVRALPDAKIIGKSSVWISDINLNYTPTPIYRDSPLYLKDRHLTLPEETRRQTYSEDFHKISLETRALLIEAQTAYDNGDYERAKVLFNLVAHRKDGHDLGTYAGLYLVNYKLGRYEEAEKAFFKVVSISVEKYRFLTVKYLFGVNSVEFLKDKDLRERYDTWIRNIGKYFHNTDYCLRIVGHASHTGTKAYNNQLSLDRAKRIQKRLQKTFPEVFQRTETVGKGFSENIVGIGTDDERDALDRRVELFIDDCK